MRPDKSTLDELRIDRAKAPHRGLPMALVAAAFMVLAVAAGLYWWFSRTEAVVVRTVTAQELAASGGTTLLDASGYVTARREATISSKVTGKVAEVLVEEGMRVEAGQVLARLDSSNVDKALGLAKAQLESARKVLDETQANLDQAEREWQRLSRLVAEHAANQVELDRAERDAKSLRARLDRETADATVSQREVAIWEQQVDDTIIRAPFSGIVTSKNAQPGEMISPMSAGGSFTRTGICTVVDMASLEIEVDVSENYINRVKPALPVVATLDSYPDWHIPAKVIAIIPTADRQKATVKVRVSFEVLDPRILPDMSVKVAFMEDAAAAEPQRGVVLPKKAVHQVEGRDMVWVVRNGRVEQRAVTLGAVRGEQVEISAGLAGGDRVVIEAAANLAEGATVTEATR